MLIDAASRQPVYIQIIRQVEEMIAAGIMRPGESLPSVRSLSLELSINPNTIQRAYADLDSRGIIYAVPGRGCYVSENAPVLLDESRQDRLRSMEKLAKEMERAGIPLEEVLDCVRRAYDA